MFQAIRLVNNKTVTGYNKSHVGIVEIYFENKWKILGDNHWTIADSNVVCHHLGYEKAADNMTFALQWSRSYLSIDFKCNGDEGELNNCRHDKTEPQPTAVKHGVGVRCIVKGINPQCPVL